MTFLWAPLWLKKVNLSSWIIPLILTLAPACAPQDSSSEPRKNLVFLTDTTRWPKTEWRAYRDSLEQTNHRIIISGYPEETATELRARLPWLLQPGVDVLLYDPRLAGSAGWDSLRLFLKDHPLELILWE
ncbi:MAG: hypothetical protein AAFN92_09490 [Bacteroidota bacterium]